MTSEAHELDPANPFSAPSTQPYGLPDFTAVRDEHYLPAVLTGMAQQRAEIEAVVTDEAEPTVENTLEALERSGRLLDRALSAFYVRYGADSTPALQDVEAEIAPLLAAHSDAIWLDERLHARVEALASRVEAEGVSLTPDTAWLLHRTRIKEEKLLAIAGLSAMPSIPAYKALQTIVEAKSNDAGVLTSARRQLFVMKRQLFGDHPEDKLCRGPLGRGRGVMVDG